jgi:two-component system response regulator NreC
MLDQRHGSRWQGAPYVGDNAGVAGAQVRGEPSVAVIRVALADDRMLLRADLRLLLATEPSVEVISAAGDFEDVERGVRDHRPDVLVLDIATPDRATLAAISRLRDRSPRTQIVVLTSKRERTSVAAVMEAGALGFVTRDSVDGDLAGAVLAAARGERYVSPDLEAQPSPGAVRTRARDRLTTRELEVLRLIALGHTSVEIARAFQLSPRTVETHRARIHKKLELASRAELVGYALRRGLIRG